MPSEFERIGYSEGYLAALKCRKRIAGLDKTKLPQLAGEQMELAVNRLGTFYDNDRFKTGFWEGFWSNAETRP